MKSKESRTGNSNISSYSVQQLLNDYKLCLETANRSPKTISRYFYTLRQLFKILGLNYLTAEDNKTIRSKVRTYIQHLQNSTRWPNRHSSGRDYGGLSPFTIQDHVRDIKVFWSWMYKEGYIDDNPLHALPLPSVPQNLIMIVSPENFKTLFSCIDSSTLDGPKYRCILLIFYDNGIRLSELVNIKISDIDFTNLIIKVTGKRRIQRLVPITVYTRRQIKKYIDGERRRNCPEDCPYLFANQYGNPIAANSVQQFMRRLLAKAGLKGVRFSPHILRHSSATQFLVNGGSINVLKDILGHKSLTTTLKYTHLGQQDVQNQHAKYSPVAQLFRKDH